MQGSQHNALCAHSGFSSSQSRFPAFFPREERQRTGRSGERIAAAFLRAEGLCIWAANVRVGRGEIDIVAFDPRDCVLVCCEVKTRTAVGGDYAPSLAWTLKKKRNVRSAARAYVAATGWDGGFRLDLVLVAGGRVVGHCREVAIEEP